MWWYKNYQIKEINAGFNNSIFCINNKFIVKVCGNINKENLFDTEVNFYNTNQNNKNIPILYRYDKSKKDVPYVYEIIEKVEGKSVYYYFYKMNETQKEELIKKLTSVLKEIHSNFNKTIYMFNEEEKNIILKSLEKYDEILFDNRFCLIHNDLHFDNILLDAEGNIKLIDFNDVLVAPFDFDLRLLYMSVSLPWKWANIEMDLLQQPKDYKYLF